MIKLQVQEPYRGKLEQLAGKKVFLVCGTLRPETMYVRSLCLVIQMCTLCPTMFVCSLCRALASVALYRTLLHMRRK